MVSQSCTTCSRTAFPAFQWFGNLVTMKWWSDLWLNEGFATLMEYLGTSAINEDRFRMDEHFVMDALSNALDRDSRASSHPLYFEIGKAEDVDEAFDTISYDKGGSVLRMLRNVMGEKYFKKGLTVSRECDFVVEMNMTFKLISSVSELIFDLPEHLDHPPEPLFNLLGFLFTFQTSYSPT